MLLPRPRYLFILSPERVQSYRRISVAVLTIPQVAFSGTDDAELSTTLLYARARACHVFWIKIGWILKR